MTERTILMRVLSAIDNDRWAAGFQTMTQYRKALRKLIEEELVELNPPHDVSGVVMDSGD